MVTLRPGIYLEDRPPTRRQFRRGRRSPPKAVIVINAALARIDRSGGEPTAEGVARSICRRAEPGSCHLVGDRESIIQLVRFEDEAFHDGTGSFEWAIGIALAVNAEDWGRVQDFDELLDSAATMAAIAARWMIDQGLAPPAPRRLGRSESERSDASGFVPLGPRRPRPRPGPGVGFPWDRFFERYRRALDEIDSGPDRPELIRQLQALVGASPDGVIGPRTIEALNRNWLGHDRSFDPSVADSFANNPVVIEWVQTRLNTRDGVSLTVDGIFGPLTEQATRSVLARGGIVAAESFIELLETRSTPNPPSP